MKGILGCRDFRVRVRTRNLKRQRLKPVSFQSPYGTVETVPYKASSRKAYRIELHSPTGTSGIHAPLSVLRNELEQRMDLAEDAGGIFREGGADSGACAKFFADDPGF